MEMLPRARGWVEGRLLKPGLLVLKLQVATWVSRKAENEKEGEGRELYFCKLAPHKSNMQPSREKAGKKGAHAHICEHSHTREERGN